MFGVNLVTMLPHFVKRRVNSPSNPLFELVK
jgi:hypothetical protein